MTTTPPVAQSPPDGPVIRFDDVAIGFDHPVLEGISFELPRGETKVLMGVSGTGKTLTLKLALGLLKPDSGRITVLDEEVTNMREEELFGLRRNIGMVFQESALFDSLTVEENVAYRLIEETGRITEEIHHRVLEALRFVELEHTVFRFPSELQEACAAASPLRELLSPSRRSCSTTCLPAEPTRYFQHHY